MNQKWIWEVFHLPSSQIWNLNIWHACSQMSWVFAKDSVALHPNLCCLVLLILFSVWKRKLVERNVSAEILSRRHHLCISIESFVLTKPETSLMLVSKPFHLGRLRTNKNSDDNPLDMILWSIRSEGETSQPAAQPERKNPLKLFRVLRMFAFLCSCPFLWHFGG